MMRYWSSPAMTERSEAEVLLLRIHQGFTARSVFQWGVERKEDGRLLGTLHAVSSWTPTTCARSSAITWRARYWEQGYMREALTALIDYAFGPMKLRRLEADVDPRNAEFACGSSTTWDSGRKACCASAGT